MPAQTKAAGRGDIKQILLLMPYAGSKKKAAGSGGDDYFSSDNGRNLLFGGYGFASPR